MAWAGKVIGSTVIAVSAFVTGVLVTPSPPLPAPEVREVTKYVDRNHETTKYVIHPDCLALVAAAERGYLAVDAYEEILGEVSKILDDSYSAIYRKDLKDINALKQKEIRLEQASIEYLLDIREAQERVGKLKPKCDKAMGR